MKWKHVTLTKHRILTDIYAHDETHVWSHWPLEYREETSCRYTPYHSGCLPSTPGKLTGVTELYVFFLKGDSNSSSNLLSDSPLFHVRTRGQKVHHRVIYNTPKPLHFLFLSCARAPTTIRSHCLIRCSYCTITGLGLWCWMSKNVSMRKTLELQNPSAPQCCGGKTTSFVVKIPKCSTFFIFLKVP